MTRTTKKTVDGSIVIKQPRVVLDYDRASFIAIVITLVLALVVITVVLVNGLNQSRANGELIDEFRQRTDAGFLCVADLAAENTRRIKLGTPYNQPQAEQFFIKCVNRLAPKIKETVVGGQ